MAARLFVRRRDGRVEVRLNDDGRAFVRALFAEVVAAERDPNHVWRGGLLPPIDPSRDEDDPLTALQRQQQIATNAELALMTIDDQFLNEPEAWVWLSTLQVALRATALTHGLLDDERLAGAEPAIVEQVHGMQQLLFELADCL
ncbi:MAG: hypothetical protein KGJ10_08130 [Acidobacteriota bacterium]|nr:hypothetical protein [Acidobacteriota bacterium]MDE3044773.1 hypothetical protein [Acidobacteriota bacterium]MDE3107302.1 hypothetical protein [Acidobacteriota bacterium]